MSPPQKKSTPVLKKQPIMRRVVLASAPCIAGSVYFFGWRSLAVVAVSCLFGFLTEYLFCKKRGESVTEAVFVSAVIFASGSPSALLILIRGLYIHYTKTAWLNAVGSGCGDCQGS